MKKIILIMAVVWCSASFFLTQAQPRKQYHSHQELNNRLQGLAEANPDLCTLNTLITTEGGKKIVSLTISESNGKPKPAVALIGGVDGTYLLGSELVVGFAENLLANRNQDSVRNLLDSVTFYLLPNVSPDASEQYFQSPRFPRKLNAQPTDNDRDGRIDEDPFEDLNGDGLITMMRIKDETGRWTTHPDDPRVMIKARPEKQERGQWELFTEGRDNDRDLKFNEDGPGGIAFNHNLPYAYKNFTEYGGNHAAAAPEVRAVLDFLYDHWNIFAVVTFGPSDNLASALKGSDENKKIPSSWKTADAEINQWMATRYQKSTNLPGTHESRVFDGDFLQWAYYHYGRFSFGTPGWYIPKIEGKKSKSENPEKEPFNAEINALKYADSTGWENIFVEWQSVEHPDYPDQLVEVGGFRPFFPQNPPETAIDSLIEQHSDFIFYLARQHPQSSLVNVKTEKLDNQLTRISVDFYNRGNFPALAEMAVANKWLKKPVVRLQTDSDQHLVSGRKVNLLDNLTGDSSQTFEWIIKGKGRVTIEAGAPQMGFDAVEINL